MQQSTTSPRRLIIQTLLSGGNIAQYGACGYRLRDANHNVVKKISNARMWHLERDLLRMHKKTKLYVIDLRKVRSMSGNCLAKQMYKELKGNNQ